MKIALIQMNVSLDKKQNLLKASENIKKSADGGADFVVLPEMFNCPYSNDYFKTYAEGRNGESYTALKNAAAENRVYLIGGSIPEIEDGKYYNTSFAFDRSGAEIACHRKVHLFDIDVKGGQRFFESETFSAGDSVTVFDTEFGKMGLMVCFDIRFPELCRLTSLYGAKVLFVPAAFNNTTGPLHWEILFRTRAVDNQMFTVGVSPALGDTGVYAAYGNSIAVDPWGKILYIAAGSHETMETVELDLGEIDRVREQLPLISSMRHDVYNISENKK